MFFRVPIGDLLYVLIPKVLHGLFDGYVLEESVVMLLHPGMIIKADVKTEPSFELYREVSQYRFLLRETIFVEVDGAVSVVKRTIEVIYVHQDTTLDVSISDYLEGWGCWGCFHPQNWFFSESHHSADAAHTRSAHRWVGHGVHRGSPA